MAKPKLGSVGKKTSPFVVRLAVFVPAYLGACAYVLSRIGNGEVLEVAPYFLVAIALQFLPFVVRETADPFEPSGLNSILTLLALVPALTTYIVNDEVRINLLPQVSGRTRIELVQTVMIAYVIGTVSYFAGYYMGVSRRVTRIFPDVAGGTWKRSRLIIVSLAAASVFLPAYAWFQSRVGTSLTDITHLAAGKAVWREDTTMSWLMRATSLGFIPPILFVATNFPKLRWGRAIATTGLFLVIAFLTVRLGQRGTAVYCLLNALIIIHYLGRRIPLGVLVGIGFGLLVLTNLLGAYRNTSSEQLQYSAAGPTANFGATETITEHEEDRERIAAVAVVFHYFPDRKDYLLGESWGPVLTTFIPRWLWPNKGYHFLWRETAIVRNLTGSPTPVNYLGLLYANFSWLGIVFGMFGWGFFQRGLYEWFLKNDKDRSVVVLYSAYVMYVGPTLLQLSAALGFTLPIYLALRFMRVAPPKPKKQALLGVKASQRPPAALPEPSPAPAAE